MTDPTHITYDGLAEAYDFFNQRLFGLRLPHCLITMQRKKSVYGYFHGRRFGTVDGTEVTDEIALNPSHFRSRTTAQSLSTLAHEMTHLEQHHFGQPSRSGHHNKQWGDLMRAIGLAPSSTGAPGGKETGQKVSHYIVDGGPFDRACTELERQGFTIRYVELGSNPEATKKKAASKTKYTCSGCKLNAWAKPDAKLVCGDCELVLVAEEPPETEA